MQRACVLLNHKVMQVYEALEITAGNLVEKIGDATHKMGL